MPLEDYSTCGVPLGMSRWDRPYDKKEIYVEAAQALSEISMYFYIDALEPEWSQGCLRRNCPRRLGAYLAPNFILESDE